MNVGKRLELFETPEYNSDTSIRLPSCFGGMLWEESQYMPDSLEACFFF